MKTKLKLFKTNWINVLGIFLAVYLFLIAVALANQENSFFSSLLEALIGSLVSILGYGLVFWVGFLAVLFILDMLLLDTDAKNVTSRLLLEWAIISVPFAYWLVKYSEWVFLVAIVAFLISQFVRRRMIVDVLS